jgi:hypothetical protein
VFKERLREAIGALSGEKLDQIGQRLGIVRAGTKSLEPKSALLRISEEGVGVVEEA